MPFKDSTHPVHWEEDGYTVTRTNSWSPPGDHPTAAGMLLYVKDGKLVKVEGDPEHSVTKGALPIRLLSLPQYVHNPDRIIYPMKRDPKYRGQADKWERCTSEEAYDIIEAKWREIVEDFGSAEPVLSFVGTGRQAGLWGATWACSVFNSPQCCYMQSGWSCAGPRTSAHSWVLGAPYATTDYAGQFPDSYDNPNYKVPEVYMLWGKEPLKSNPDGYWGHSIVDLCKKGMKLIVIDPRLTWEAAHAEYWLQLRPGTDAALAMAMCNVIVSEDLYDHDFVEKWCFGFEQFAERVKTMTPEQAAEICDIDVDKIYGAARLYASGNPSTYEMGLAVDQNPNGNQIVHCLLAMLAITGNVDKPGSTIMGGIDLGGLGSGYPDLEPQSLVDKMCGIEEFPALVRTLMYIDPDSTLDQLESDEPYAFRMSFSHGANSIACPCNVPKRWENAMKKLELNIVADLFMTPHAQAVCDIFLPVTTFAEMDMYVTFWYGASGQYVFPINKAMEPVGECKSDITYMREIGMRLRPEIWSEYKSDIDYINKNKFATLPITFEELRDHGWWYVDYEYGKYETGKLRPDGAPGFMTPTGRVELYSTMIESWGDDPLPYYKEPPTSPVSTPDYAEKYPYVLSTGQRTWSYFHSEQRQVPLLREVEPWPLVEMSPATAAKEGLVDGDWVWLENDNGKAKYRAAIRPGVRDGCLFAQHAWWYPDRVAKGDMDGLYEVAINNLTPYKVVGKLGYGAPYKCLMCKIYKAD